MKPFFFGAPERPLFGIYHPPADHVAVRGAVVLCYPFGAEYLRSHRALRELASHLAASGHHALRFDYYGCGDSSGATEEGSVGQWLDDIGRAIEELRETSGVSQVCLLGLRLGATLAALRASRSAGAVDRLVLWEPILSGRAYLEELAARHRALLAVRAHPPDWVETSPPGEALGTPLPPALRESIEAVDVLSERQAPARRALLVSTDEASRLGPLLQHLQQLGVEARLEHVPSPPLWLKQDEFDRTLVPHQVIQRVADWLSGAPA